MEVTGKNNKKEWEIFIEHLLCIKPFPLILIFPRTNPYNSVCGRHYYHLHFVEKEIEAPRD